LDYDDVFDAIETLTLLARSSPLLAKIIVRNVTASFIFDSFHDATQRCGSLNHPDIDKFLQLIFDFVEAICVGAEVDVFAETNPDMRDVILNTMAFALAEGGTIWP
jgi:hypothetical protein